MIKCRVDIQASSITNDRYLDFSPLVETNVLKGGDTGWYTQWSYRWSITVKSTTKFMKISPDQVKMKPDPFYHSFYFF